MPTRAETVSYPSLTSSFLSHGSQFSFRLAANLAQMPVDSGSSEKVVADESASKPRKEDETPMQKLLATDQCIGLPRRNCFLAPVYFVPR